MIVLQSASGSGEGAGVVLLILIIGIGLYFLPTGIAALRKKRNMAPILLVNLFFGWSVIGWIIALVWAFTYDAAVVPPVVIGPTLDTRSETEVLRAELRALQAETALANKRRGADGGVTGTDTSETITPNPPPSIPRDPTDPR